MKGADEILHGEIDLTCSDFFKQIWIFKAPSKILAHVRLATLWIIWGQRNEIVFNGGQCCKLKMMEMIKMRSWQWNKARLKGFHFSLYDWSHNVRSVMQQNG